VTTLGSRMLCTSDDTRHKGVGTNRHNAPVVRNDGIVRVFALVRTDKEALIETAVATHDEE
jgi:hypothetical protein